MARTYTISFSAGSQEPIPILSSLLSQRRVSDLTLSLPTGHAGQISLAFVVWGTGPRDRTQRLLTRFFRNSWQRRFRHLKFVAHSVPRIQRSAQVRFRPNHMLYSPYF